MKLSFTIDGGEPGDYAYRIYFYPMDQANVYDGRFDKTTSLLYGQSLKEQISLTYLTESNLAITAGTYQSYLNWDEDAEAYYLEFQVAASGTAGGTIYITYPSPTTPGGELAIFGAIYDVTSGALVSNTNTEYSREAFLAVWTTEKQEFEVSIENKDQKTDGLILSVDDGGNVYVSVTNNPDQPIIWNITMEKTVDSHEDEDIGEDLITGISVTDTIKLPDGITWTGSDDGELITGDADENGEITFSDSNGKTLLTLENSSKIAAGSFVLKYDAESSSLIVTWEIANSATNTDGFVTSEISNSVWQVRLNGDYLTYSDDDGSIFEKAGSHEITNTVHYDYHYAWSEDEESESSASISIATAGSGVVLTKTADRSGDTVYMGEDAYYTISLYNQGSEATKDLATLNDSALSNEQYISSENIWKMFFPEEADETKDGSDSYDPYVATDSGDYLTITITDATVYYSDPLDENDFQYMTDIDGKGQVLLTNANYYLDDAMHDKGNGNAGATIVMVKDTQDGQEGISVTFYDDDTKSTSFHSFFAKNLEELETELNKIGFVVTQSATYSAVWNLTEHQLEPGKIRHYKVYSSLKSTLQYYNDAQNIVASPYNIAGNTVFLEYQNEGFDETDDAYKEAEEATAQYTSIAYDFRIDKSVNSIDQESVTGEVEEVYDGSVIEYSITVWHFGDGEAEDLTLTDYIENGYYQNGILLIPVNEKNIQEIRNGNWDITENGFLRESNHVTINGATYFKAMYSFTCKNVWFSDDVCASSVTSEYYGSGRYTITWNFSSQLEESQAEVVNYYVLAQWSSHVAQNSARTANTIKNIVYLGRYVYTDQYKYTAIHDGVYSSLYDMIDSIRIIKCDIEKNILVSKDGEEEKFDTISEIDLNEANSYEQEVRYKLKINLNTEEGDENNRTFTNVIDVLPYTYGVFSWIEEDNVEVYRYTLADGTEVETIGYEIYYSDAEGNEINTTKVNGIVMMEDGSTPAYQSIRFYTCNESGEKENANIIIPNGTTSLNIYVKLTFSMEATKWEGYANSVSGNLVNKFQVSTVKKNDNDGYFTETYTSRVEHTVRTDNKAYLQKGVLEISKPNSLAGAQVQENEREIYYSATETDDGQTDGSKVAYYITIYNPGSANLYLTEIQDLVPEGFTLDKIYGGISSYNNDLGSTYSIVTNSDDPATDLIDSSEVKVNWISAVVIVSEDEKSGIIRYTFSSDSSTDIKKDNSTGLYYLAQYDAISFIVVFSTGTVDETEEYSTNTIAMPYVNISGSELEATSVKGEAKDINGLSDARQNVGGCEIYDETSVLDMDFEPVEEVAEADMTQWLVSAVTVQRGEIIPGIKKTVDSSAENGVSGEITDTVKWTIEVTNDGDIPMVNYTITDTVDFPFQICGDIYIAIYDANDTVIVKTGLSEDTGKETPLLTINSRNTDGYSYSYYSMWSEYADKEGPFEASNNTIVDFSSFGPMNIVYFDGNYWVNEGNLAGAFKIEMDEDGHDIFTLKLEDTDLAIPAGGKLVLTIETKPSETAASGVYYNEATVTPVQSYDDDAVTIGEAVSAADSGGQPYVRSSDQVVVTGGYSTTSQKWIQSIKNTGKIANSEMDNDDGVRYIVLDNEEETFRYTLEVANNLGTTMDKLLIVDVLPQSGDYAPFTVQGSTTARYSEFQVDLLTAEKLNLQVVLGTKKSGLDEDTVYAADFTIENQETLKEGTEYTVYYSACTSFGTGMRDNALLDLSAEDSSGNPIWTTDPTGARAIRIELSCSVPTNYVVQVSFNAKVSDADNLSNKNVAKPGEIAWNSFAYRYSTTDSSGGADTVTLWAAPRKVGVKIPESDGNYELPLTGGAGTLVHTTAGLLLSGGAACLMYKKKKRKGGCAS